MAITTQQKTDAYQFFTIAFGAAPGVAYLNQLDEAYSAGLTTKQIVNIYTQKTQFTDLYPNFISNEQFAISLIANVLGTTVSDAAKAEAQADITGSLNAGSSRGDVIFQIFTNLAAKPFSDPMWGDTAKLLANKVAVARYVTEIKLVNSLDPVVLQGLLDNVTSSSDVSTPAMIEAILAGSGGTGGNNIQNFTLTTGQDIYPGTAGSDVIRGVAGTPIGGQDQTTLNSSDVLNGGGGEDTLALLLNGNYGGGATISNIETLQIATNSAVPVSFDFNVNQGNFEVTGVNTIVFDQITAGEVLNINNLTRASSTVAAGVTTTTTPELKWANEVGATAGTIGVTYRQESTNGNADVQKVALQNVSAVTGGAAQMNIGAGIETIIIKSTGSMNTLNNSANADTGNNAVAADIISSGSLTKVILEGDMAIGKTGGVVAATGLTDRVVGADNGITANTSSSSNLLSVGSRVTEVDASAMTGAANVRFVAKTGSAATNVTFKGGSASDYVEFELGNITATGGAGADTFAFINGGANATFGEGDKIDGGEGADTIQLGLNGVGTFNISETELRNKTSIESVDMRGLNNSLTLSSDFVAASDTEDRVEVHTDRIVQSASSSANPVNGASNGAENNSTNTIRLTQLTSGQGVDLFGGSGSDRVILNDSTFNVLQNLDGGVYNDNALIGAGRADTITVVTNGENVVIDAQDLSNVRNFEGLVLTKNSAAANYDITLTAAFLSANTKALDAVNTTWDDSVLQIGTAAAANNAALSAGDVVRIDITDLLSGNALKASLAGRAIDTSSLPTVQFIVNGAAASALQIAAVTRVDAAQADVLGSIPNPGAIGGGVSYTSGIGANLNVLGSNGNDTFTLTQADVVTAGTGNDTVNLNAGSAGATVTLGAGADTVNINTLIQGGVNVVSAIAAGSTINVNANQGGSIAGDIVTAGASTFNVSVAQSGGFQTDNFGHTINATAGGSFQLAAVAQTFNGSGGANYTVTGGAGADTITMTNTGASVVAGGAGRDTINIAGNTGVSTIAFNDGVNAAANVGVVAAVDRDVVTGFSANDVIRLDINQTTAPTGSGVNAVVQVSAGGAPVVFNAVGADVLVLNFDMGGAVQVLGNDLTGAALLANLGGALSTGAAGENGYIVAYDNGNAYLYALTNTVGAAVTAGEIALIGTFDNVAVGGISAANLLMAS